MSCQLSTSSSHCRDLSRDVGLATSATYTLRDTKWERQHPYKDPGPIKKLANASRKTTRHARRLKHMRQEEHLQCRYCDSVLSPSPQGCFVTSVTFALRTSPPETFCHLSHLHPQDVTPGVVLGCWAVWNVCMCQTHQVGCYDGHKMCW